MFGNKKENASGGSSTTIITECMNIEGNIKGCGTMHIDGTIRGDIYVEDALIIGEKGKVIGTIRSKQVLVSGTIEGSLVCDTLEVTKTGHISNDIKAKKVTSDGTLEASILVEESINITDNGKVKASKMESKHVTVSGHVSGNIVATELLEVNKNGQTKGEMVVKKIKVAEGGLVLGTMLTYEASNSVRTVKENAEKKAEEVKSEVKTKEDKK